jgi:hypothetical protein
MRSIRHAAPRRTDALPPSRVPASLLVRAAPLNKYAPRNPPGAESIDITSPESRRAAFNALRADMAAAAKPKMARAEQAKTLNSALELFPAILDMASIELAANGSTDETRADVASIGEHARDLMQAQIGRVQRRVNSLGDLAYSTEEGDRRGLFSNEVKELPPMIAELRRIEKTARDVRSRAQELGIPATAWEQIAIDAADVADAGERILEAGAPNTRS